MGIVEITSIIMILFGVVCIIYSKTIGERFFAGSPGSEKGGMNSNNSSSAH